MEPIVKETILKYINPLVNNNDFINKLDYLRQRWQDEQEYEDWKEYEALLKKYVPEGCIFVRSTKRPIGIVFKIPTIAPCVHVFAKVKGQYLTINAQVVKA
jgi:hypothetical protein